MTKDEWEALLSKWAAGALEREKLPPSGERLSGLGAPGATEVEIAAAETRLSCKLPNSYREFLKCTNGLRQPLEWMVGSGGHFHPVAQIEWFRTRNAGWIAAYGRGPSRIPDARYFVYGREQDSIDFRVEYFRETLEISGSGDDGVYLLNPKIVTPEGEWEAWFFANWFPGAVRYRTFADMMLEHYETFRAGDTSGF